MSQETPMWVNVFWIVVIVFFVVRYYTKKKKKLEEEAEKTKQDEINKKKNELSKKERITEKITKLETLTKQIQEIKTIKVNSVDELKTFIVANETAITNIGGETKLFEFLKLDTFLNDYRQKIVKDIDYTSNSYNQYDIENAIKAYENQDPLSKIIDDLGDISAKLSDKQGGSTNAKVDLLFKIGHKLKPSIEAELYTLDFYKSLSMAMVIFYLDNKKIRYFEIYEAFEKLGVFDSSWQKNVAAKLESIDLRLAQMNEQMTTLNERFTRIADNTEAMVTELKTGLGDISQRLNLNNVLTGITAYQTYQINKSTKTLT